RFDPGTEKTQTWEVKSNISAIALRGKGGAVVALESGVYTLDFDSGATAPLAMLPSSASDTHFNDGKVDRAGRFIIATLDCKLMAPNAAIYRLDVDASLHQIDTDICTGNGPCWSPDDRIFYFADTMSSIIYACDYEIQSGTLSGRRLFARTDEIGGMPDGMTVDADGLLWVALVNGGRIACYRPDGKIERTIEMPVPTPTSITFGGDALDQLFVTSLDTTVLKKPFAEGSGETFVIGGLGSRGVPEPLYRG